MSDREQSFDNFRSGSELAFRQVMNQHIHALTFHAYKICRRTEIAEEIVADTFAKLWQNRHNFQTETNVKAFLYITTRNACRDYLRSAQRRVAGRTDELDEHLQEPHADPLTHMIHAELIRSLVEEIEKLPERQSEVFRMTYLENLTTEEICERLGISANAVFLARKKATAKIRSIFAGRDLWMYLVLLDLLSGN